MACETWFDDCHAMWGDGRERSYGAGWTGPVSAGTMGNQKALLGPFDINVFFKYSKSIVF
jgi:hypothetical protein